jgi:hypothetical protein
VLDVKQWTEGRRMQPVERPASREDPPAAGSAQGDDPEGVVVVDDARLFTAVAGPPQEALKPPIAALASPYGLGPRDDGRFACQRQANAKGGQCSALTPTRQQRGGPAIAFSLEEALWIKRSQRVRSFGAASLRTS